MQRRRLPATYHPHGNPRRDTRYLAGHQHRLLAVGRRVQTVVAGPGRELPQSARLRELGYAKESQGGGEGEGFQADGVRDDDPFRSHGSSEDETHELDGGYS